MSFSSAPSTLDGSGEPVLKKIVGKGSEAEPGANATTAIREGLNRGISSLARLLSDEVLGQAYRRQGFGHAYELAYHDGDTFRYATDVAYLVLHTFFDRDGKFQQATPLSPYFIYRALDDASLVERRHIKTTINQQTIKGAVGVERYVITPVTVVTNKERDELTRTVLGRNYRLSAESEFQCAFVLISSPDLQALGKPWVSLASVSRKDDPAKLVTLKDVDRPPPLTDADVSVQGKALEWAYEGILENERRKS